MFSEDLSTIPDSGTHHGFELTSQRTPDRSAERAIPAVGQLNSEERKHYNRALRDLCRIVKVSSRKLDAVNEALLSDDQSGVGQRGSSRSWTSRRHRSPLTSEEFASLSDPDVTMQVAASGSESLDRLRLDGRYGRYGDEEDFLDEREDYTTRIKREKEYHHRTPTRNYHSGLSEDYSAGKGSRKSSMNKSPMKFEAVYAELVTISTKLQAQSAALHEKEESLRERERALEAQEGSVLTNQSTLRQAYKDFSKKWHTLQEEHDKQVKELEAVIREKGKENKRQKESFDTLKQGNDGLKSQLDKVQEQNKKLESHTVSLQSRLTNLLRRQELTGRQRDQDSIAVKARAESVRVRKQSLKDTSSSSSSSHKAAGPRIAKHPSGLYDALGILLEWVSEVHLRHHSTDPSKPLESLPSPALTLDRCMRVLPALVEVLGQLPSQAAKLHLPCLQFIYWALLQLGSNDKQHVNLSSTYRRLGDELYRPMVVRFAADHDKTCPEGVSERPKAAIFFKSSNLHIRFLSSLVILKTVTQVDYLANVFDVLRCDLKEERAKELYLRYQATPVITPYMKAGNRAVMGCAVDIFLQMSMESIFMQQFLYGLCTEAWFKACALLLSSPGLDVKVMEKLSIILQKLSKIRTNKHLFDASGASAVILEMSRSGACQENAFLILNIRSILFNLNLVKTNPASSLR